MLIISAHLRTTRGHNSAAQESNLQMEVCTNLPTSWSAQRVGRPWSPSSHVAVTQSNRLQFRQHPGFQASRPIGVYYLKSYSRGTQTAS